MVRLLIFLLTLLASSSVWATNYYADPNGGGAASCVDSGANVCTITRAEAVATNGDTIQAACGTYSLGGSTLTIDVNIAIAPVTDGCAIITGTNATSIVTLTAANNANALTFGAFDVQNTGGGTSSTMLVSNVAYDAVIELSGTRITVGGTNRHLADQWTRGTLKLTNVRLSGTIGAQAGIYSVVTPSSAKKVSITGGISSLTASASNTPIIYYERAAGTAVTEWVEVYNHTGTVTVPTSLGASAFGVGIRYNRISYGTNLSGSAAPSVIDVNTITVTATAGTSNDSYAIVTSSTDATATADGVLVRYNIATCNAPAARCVSVGTDGTTAFNAADSKMYGNLVTNLFYDGSATPHGIQCGRVTNCHAYGNRVRGGAVGLLSAIGTNANMSGNLVEGAYYAPLFAKGNTTSRMTHNTVIMDDRLYGAKFGTYGCLGVAAQGGTNNAATTFQNNACKVKNGTGWKYTVVDASQVASFEHNDYHSDVSLTTPWSYQGSATAVLATWNANATVGDDLNVDPGFLSSTDYRLSPSSLLNQTGLYIQGCADARVRTVCPIPPSIGAYQRGSGDLATR